MHEALSLIPNITKNKQKLKNKQHNAHILKSEKPEKSQALGAKNNAEKQLNLSTFENKVRP
jgi:hypothetical protein